MHIDGSIAAQDGFGLVTWCLQEKAHKQMNISEMIALKKNFARRKCCTKRKPLSLCDKIYPCVMLNCGCFNLASIELVSHIPFPAGIRGRPPET